MQLSCQCNFSDMIASFMCNLVSVAAMELGISPVEDESSEW